MKILKRGERPLRAGVSGVDMDEWPDQYTINAMERVMDKAGGVGLSANQVGLSDPFFIMKPPGGELQVFVNPQLVSVTKESLTEEEGCLSVPGIFVGVERHTGVQVRYMDLFGDDVVQNFSGFEARIIQHEMDHLDGVLISDYRG